MNLVFFPNFNIKTVYLLLLIWNKTRTAEIFSRENIDDKELNKAANHNFLKPILYTKEELSREK